MITKNQAQQISDDIKEAMESIAKKHNLVRLRQGVRYGDLLNLTVSFKQVDGKDKETVTYERWYKALSLPPLKSKLSWKAKDGSTVVGIICGMVVGGPYKNVILEANNHKYKMKSTEVVKMWKNQNS